MIDMLTTKQWFLLSCVLYALITYFGYSFRRDMTILAAMLLIMAEKSGINLIEELRKRGHK
jgi:hypothetical protein